MASEIYTGVVTGTGANINISLGFVPDYVEVINYTAPASGKWFKGMPAGSAFKHIAGTGGLTKITSLGISEYAGVAGGATPGFTIGADTAINVATNPIYWVAGRNGP